MKNSISKITYHKDTVVRLQELIISLYKEIDDLKEQLEAKDKIMARQARDYLATSDPNQDNDPDGYRSRY